MKRFTPYLFLLFTVLMIMTLPLSFVENFRGKIIALISFHEKEGAPVQELIYLELENHLLKNEIAELRELQNAPKTEAVQAIPARVIYRSLSTWNSSLWINVGEDDNIDKNNPVTLGKAAIGVIDFVEKKKSRVRLITDIELTPSVRAVREVDGVLHYLAKGELHGSSTIQARSQAQVLQGVGFNYDFPDDFGPARDLRTGFPFNGEDDVPPISLIQPNDLLITTGMDGIFPPGLHVATVLEISPLKEGDYTYSLTAKPVIDHFDDLTLVFVLNR